MTKDWNDALKEYANNFKTLVDEVSQDLIYIGKATFEVSENDARWQIARVSKTGNVTSISFANNSDNFDKIWSQRTTYSY